MADYATLKAAIQAVIYENGNQEITGSVMQATLLAMVNSLGANYQYAGIATPSTNPGMPDQNVFYLASTAGTYVNFGNIVLAENEVAILKYNGSWTKEVSGFASAEKVDQLEAELTFDETRTLQPEDIANFNNMGISGPPWEVVASTGYRLWYLQVKAGKTITIHHNLASGWIVSGSTANIPAVGDAVSDVVRTQYSSTTKERSFTATEDCYFVFRLASAETNFYVEVPTEGFGADVREAIEAIQEQIDNDVLTKTAQELTDTEQETVRNNIGVDNALYGRKKNYFEDGRINEGKILYLDGVGTTDFIPYTPGTEIVWKFGGAGASNIRIESYDANKNYLGYYGSSGYTNTRTVTFTSNDTAYIRASFHLEVDGVANDKPVSIGGVDFVVHDAESGYTEFIESGVLEDERKWKPLPLGGLLNCDTNSSGHLNHSSTYDPIRVTTKSNICVPFPGMRIRHRIPDGLPYILCGYWWVGTSNGNHSVLPSGGSAFVNGDVITLPKTALCIRPVFRAYTTNSSSYVAPILASDIQALIDSGKLAIEYYDERGEDVVERNEATQINLRALRRELIPGGGALNGMDSMPVFAHVTDLHGDAPRWKNFLEYCDKYGVDFALETGDAVLYQKRDASQFIYDFANEHDTDVIACIGNHESMPTGSSTLFADNLSDLATKYEYLASAGTTTTKCYFYKDYDAKKVRVIVLNQHEDGVYRRRIGQAQVDWLIATLLSTPAGYGIVIAYHAPEDKVVAESPYNVFRQPEPNTGATYEPNGAYVDKRVIELLVDAFISRTSVNFTYEDHSATYNGDSDVTTQTVSVVADFSGVDETTEFICYVCGHRHEDWIGYYDNSTNKQLCLCITCGIALYGDSTNPAWANQSDLPRGGIGVSQDAFCIYAIDRLNGNVKVMRVGATVTQMMVKREMMVIPYKD